MNKNSSDFKSWFLDVTVYKKLHMFLSKFYKKTIISRGPSVRADHGPPGVRWPQFGKLCVRLKFWNRFPKYIIF